MTASDWSIVETPTDSSLFDVETAGDGAFAVGSDGLVLARTDGSWEVLVEDGPEENGNSLYGADLTPDGERVWVVGSSGTVGEYDVAEDELSTRRVDGFENAYNDVAVTGSAGDANVFVVDGAGFVHYSFENGREGTWAHVRPGSGAELKAVDFCGRRRGFVVDDDGVVHATTDGESWRPVLTETDVTLYGTACRRRARGDGDGDESGDGGGRDVAPDVWVSGDGKVCHYHGDEWRVEEVNSGNFNDVYYDDGGAVAVGGGGRVVRLAGDAEPVDTPTGETLNGVCVGSSTTAVGASGVVIEREA